MSGAAAIGWAAAACAGIASAAAFWIVASARARDPLGAFGRWWRQQRAFSRDPAWVDRLAWAVPALVAVAIGGICAGSPVAFATSLALAAAFPAAMARRAKARRLRLGQQLDGLLTALANALSVTPNLGEALRAILPFLEAPIRDELRDAIAETELGRPIDEALEALARRVGVPGFEVAVAAAITGRRTGGNLAEILEGTARTLREMARLEGVVRTKTAEGRNQALVMGLVPPVLIAALHKIDPTWLEPMWTDPIGWILLGVAAVLEVAAVALIRKIMAVDV